MGKAVDLQQVGNTWTEGDDIVSLSLNGDLNIFDKRVGDKPARVLHVCLCTPLSQSALTLYQAPPRAITALAPTSSSGTFIAGLADGRVLSFSGSEYKYADGPGHSNLVVGITSAPDGKVFSAGYDDQVRELSPETVSFVYVNEAAVINRTS